MAKLLQRLGWLRLYHQSNPTVPLDYESHVKSLKDVGFKLIDRQKSRSRGFTVYQTEPCNFLRMTWFLNVSGIGYRWEVWWNIPRLKSALKNEIDPHIKRYLNACKTIRDRYRHFCAKKRVDPLSPEEHLKYRQDPEYPKWDLTPQINGLDKIMNKYRELRAFLTQTPNVMSHPTYVWIPGIENIRSYDYGLFTRLHKFLGSPVFGVPEEQSGPPLGIRTMSLGEVRKCQSLHKKGRTIPQIARALFADFCIDGQVPDNLKMRISRAIRSSQKKST